MEFGHRRLQVYQVATEYFAWLWGQAEDSRWPVGARSQILRAAQSIMLNIAEGNAKPTAGERRRFFEIARGSVAECSAIQDVLVITGSIARIDSDHGQQLLSRIMAMLIKLGRRGFPALEPDPETRAEG